MSNIPAMYDYINRYNSSFSPSTVHCKNTALTNFFSNYLVQRAMSIYRWTMPSWWNENYPMYMLYCWGFYALINTNRWGVVPQWGGLQGYNIMYNPTHVVISNPLLRGTHRLEIGITTEIIKMQPNYGSIMDIVSFYADLLSLTAEALGMNIVNSKLSVIFSAGNQAMAESFKKLYDRQASGEPMTVIDKKLMNKDGTNSWDYFMQNLRDNFITPDILDAFVYITNMFDTEIGIPNANTRKKERVVVDEINSNNVETYTKASLWLEELQKCCTKANKMFKGLNLWVDWRFPPEQGGVTNGKNVDSRTMES